MSYGMWYNTNTIQSRAVQLTPSARHKGVSFVEPQSITKTCTRCKQALPISCFSPIPRGLYGVRGWCKPCSAAYRRERYPQVREQHIATVRDYQRRHPAKTRAIAKASHARTGTEYRRAYYRQNPERVLNWNRQYRARKRGAVTSETVEYAVVYSRDKGICHICHNPVPKSRLHFDHVIPLSKGGAHTMDNIKVAHARCNIRKGNK